MLQKLWDLSFVMEYDVMEVRARRGLHSLAGKKNFPVTFSETSKDTLALIEISSQPLM